MVARHRVILLVIAFALVATSLSAQRRPMAVPAEAVADQQAFGASALVAADALDEAVEMEDARRAAPFDLRWGLP